MKKIGIYNNMSPVVTDAISIVIFSIHLFGDTVCCNFVRSTFSHFYPLFVCAELWNARDSVPVLRRKRAIICVLPAIPPRFPREHR